MANNIQKFEDLFKIIAKSAEVIETDAKAKRDWVWVLKVFGNNLFIIIALWLMLYSIVFHDLPSKNYTEVIKNMIMATVAIMTIAKYNILIYYKDTFKELIKIMDQDIVNSETYPPDEKEIVTTYIKKKIRVGQIWTVCVIIACALFPVKAFSLMIYYAFKDDFRFVPIFDFTYPRFLNDVKEEPFFFTFYQLIDIAFDIFAMFCSIAFDALAPIFLLHCCGELQLLRLRITKIFTYESDPHKILEQLKQINCRLQATYRGEINEFTFFLFGSTLQFFLPCYYSDLLMETGEIFRESIYSCGWEMRPDIKIRKTILLMLTRTVSPIVLKTLFIPLSLDAFAETCRQSYAIYNILMAIE